MSAEYVSRIRAFAATVPPGTWIQGGDWDHSLWGGELPCVPCVRNECPRTGPGYRLPTAERECMRLIEVDTVEEALSLRLSRHLT